MSACTPARFWYLSKDGGRSPLTSDLIDMIDLASSTVGIVMTIKSEFIAFNDQTKDQASNV